MMIYMLAAAMTVVMLIATAFGLHQETERMRLKEKRSDAARLRFPLEATSSRFGSRLRCPSAAGFAAF